MSASPPPTDRFTLTRLLIAITLAAVFFGAIWGATWAAGFGRDLHVLRVVAAGGVALLAALLLVWPNRKRETRVFALAAALVFGTLVWWSVPSRFGGLNLLNAAAKRDALHMQMGLATFDDVNSAGQWQNSIDDLAREYPTLAESLRPELQRWSGEAEAAVLERLRDTPSTDLAGARLVQSRAKTLGDAFPERRRSIEDAFQTWARRATLARIDELNALRPANWDEFNKTATSRHALVRAFPDIRGAMADAERTFVMKSVGDATAPALRGIGNNPRRARDACREIEGRIRILKSVDPPAEQFIAARSALFLLAHEAARLEILSFIQTADYDRAFDIANQHGLEWFAAAQKLGPNETKGLADLREQARHFSIRFEKAGLVQSAPEPRGRETAPTPRTKQ